MFRQPVKSPQARSLGWEVWERERGQVWKYRDMAAFGGCAARAACRIKVSQGGRSSSWGRLLGWEETRDWEEWKWGSRYGVGAVWRYEVCMENKMRYGRMRCGGVEVGMEVCRYKYRGPSSRHQGA